MIKCDMCGENWIQSYQYMCEQCMSFDDEFIVA